jgi:hypothetical protein
LLEEAASLFIETVRKFHKVESMRYAWVQYIPTETITDKLWNKFKDTLISGLKSNPLFFSEANNRMTPEANDGMTPDQLRIVPSSFKDDTGDPLLADLTDSDVCKGRYVSTRYDAEADLQILCHLGAKTLDLQEFIHRLEEDLAQPSSRMKSEAPDSPWHGKVVDALLSSEEIALPLLSSLPIVPLGNRSEKWIVPLNATIYFPKSSSDLDAVDVPDDIDMSLVDGQAAGNLKRRELFEKLGVRYCSVEDTLSRIQAKYQEDFERNEEKHLSHVRFLFRYHDICRDLKVPVRIWYLRQHPPSYVDPYNTDRGWLYSPEAETELSPVRVFGESFPKELEGKVFVVDPIYYQRLADWKDHPNRLTAKTWLENELKVKTTVQLRSRTNPAERSPELNYILKHRSDRLLRILEQNWGQYRDDWKASIAECKIPILDSTSHKELHHTVLPIPHLVSTVERLGIRLDFGFIKELDGITDDTLGKWKKLKQFDVVVDDNLRFWITVLRHSKAQGVRDISIMKEIYHRLWTGRNIVTEADDAILRQAHAIICQRSG